MHEVAKLITNGDESKIVVLSALSGTTNALVEISVSLSEGDRHTAKEQIDALEKQVETLQQVLYLKSLGCDIAQGYYFAEPLTPDEMVSFLSGGRGSLAESCEIPDQQPPKLIMLAA